MISDASAILLDLVERTLDSTFLASNYLRGGWQLVLVEGVGAAAAAAILLDLMERSVHVA